MRLASLKRPVIALLAAAVLAGCQTSAPPKSPGSAVPSEPSGNAEAGFSQASFSGLPPSAAADWENARTAFRRSCSSKSFASAPLWKNACINATASGPATSFFVQNFDLWSVSERPAAGSGDFQPKTSGLMTGYYEPILEAASARDSSHAWPVLGTPPDLIDVELSSLYPALKGKRVRGKLSGRKLVPYDSREAIDKRSDLYPYAIAWLSDPIDQLFLQIQGSGQLLVKGKGLVRVFYANQNGHPYRAVAKWLIDRGEMTRSEASMQSIRSWARAHPSEVPSLLAYNPSYVFFRVSPVTDLSAGPQGAQGVPLTPGASVAVDRNRWKLGVPFFVSVSQQSPQLAFNRPVIAQDTGGAIRGLIRFDYFWGSGAGAGESAGRQKSAASAWVMVPKGHSPYELLKNR